MQATRMRPGGFSGTRPTERGKQLAIHAAESIAKFLMGMPHNVGPQVSKALGRAAALRNTRQSLAAGGLTLPPQA